jgi:hypothetical protein
VVGVLSNPNDTGRYVGMHGFLVSQREEQSQEQPRQKLLKNHSKDICCRD